MRSRSLHSWRGFLALTKPLKIKSNTKNGARKSPFFNSLSDVIDCCAKSVVLLLLLWSSAVEIHFKFWSKRRSFFLKVTTSTGVSLSSCNPSHCHNSAFASRRHSIASETLEGSIATLIMASTEHVQLVCTLLAHTLNPAERRNAEQQLTQAQSQTGFLQILIAVIQNAVIQSNDAVRLAAAIKLKNICKTAWDQESAEESAVDKPVDPQDKQALKQSIVPLLVSISTTTDGRPPAPTNVRSQLQEAIALVAEKDFPHDWPNLMDDLVPKLASQDDQLVLGILRTAHTIFYRWRSAFRSDALYSEINYVLGKFAVPHLELLKRTDQRLLDPATPSASLPVLGNIMNMALQVLYDLSSQDLPPQIEDNMAPITEILARWISQSRPELDSDPDEPCSLQEIRSSICEIAELYAKRYLDAFTQLPVFVQAIWGMLGTCTLSQKYDTLVSKAVGFLSTVVRMGSSREMFKSTETLEQLCSAIILPNIAIREADEELFEDNPIEYIRRDLETSMEADTRRKAASEFCRSLMEFFAAEVTTIVSRYIAQYLEQYRADPHANWKQKDTAIYLLTSIASKSSTAQHGVTATNDLVDIVDFFSNNVFADLQQSADDSPSRSCRWMPSSTFTPSATSSQRSSSSRFCHSWCSTSRARSTSPARTPPSPSSASRAQEGRQDALHPARRAAVCRKHPHGALPQH